VADCVQTLQRERFAAVKSEAGIGRSSTSLIASSGDISMRTDYVLEVIGKSGEISQRDRVISKRKVWRPFVGNQIASIRFVGTRDDSQIM
jgi:hypothetical protein